MTTAASKVKPGDPLEFPAAFYNSLVDMVADSLRRRGLFITGGNRAVPDHDIIYLKNGSGADRDRFHVLGIDVPVILPTENEAEFKDKTPINGKLPTGEHYGKFAVLLEPIANGAFGEAMLGGVTTCKLDVQHAGDGYCDIAPGTAATLKTSGYGSAQILWKETGTGEKWGIVRLGRHSPPVFPVLVEKTGGNNGSATSTANYTYTVRTLGGGTIGANITLAMPRPNGTMTFQSGTNGLGFACYVPNGTNAATLKLLDAGEVRTTTTCSVP